MTTNFSTNAQHKPSYSPFMLWLSFFASLAMAILAIPLVGVAEEPVPSPTNPHQVYPSDDTMPKGIIGVAIYLSAHRVGDPAGLYVRAIHPEGPAAKSGVAHGDEILAVDEVPLTGKTYEQIIRMIRGDIGQKVRLQIKGNQGTRDVSIQRVSEAELLAKQKTS